MLSDLPKLKQLVNGKVTTQSRWFNSISHSFVQCGILLLDLKRYRRGESSFMADALHVTRNIREKKIIIMQRPNRQSGSHLSSCFQVFCRQKKKFLF